MEIHGSLPPELLFCDQPSARLQTVHSNGGFQQPLRFQPRESSSSSLSLKLEPDPLPECFGTLLESSATSPILGSPELNLLRLGSPELEKLIMNQQSAAHTSASSSNYLTRANCSSSTVTVVSSSEHSQSKKAISPLISAQDLQFITETNQALESILPQSNFSHRSEDHSNNCLTDEIDNFQSSLIEPLQEVPDTHDSDNLFPVISSDGRSPFHEAPINSRTNAVHLQYKHHGYSQIHNSETVLETNMPFGNINTQEKQYSTMKAPVYDLHHPATDLHHPATMVSNPFVKQQSHDIDKSSQNQHNAYIQTGNQMNFGILPLPPIDLEVQEIVKRERKKLKNRVAASKCRKKKLEREAQLEVRVQHLKEKNIELNALANALRQQATELKQRIIDHINAGCHVRLVHF